MDQFHENLKLWSGDKKNQKVAQELDPLKSPQSVSICTTQSGLPNLCLEPYQEREGKIFLHSQNDPEVEANEWFSGLDLAHVQVLFIYGIGLGYYYDAAKKWLGEDQNRYLVFLEDDLEVFHRFLETERCTRLLKDTQVYIFLLGQRNEQLLQINEIVALFHGLRYRFTGLRTYVQTKNNLFAEYRSTVAFLMSMGALIHAESLSHGLVFFRNFYLNCIGLPGSYFANSLLGKFKGVPAIICGAGPSLNKNIDVLSTLYDRALIFAGGTALNALNGMGVMPHFGVGIDPNPDQFTRLVMNDAFELPFLYRCRMLHEALKIVHGDRLYMTGSGGYEVGKWFEKKLEVDEEQLAEGFNVLNFSVVIAEAMGCNPIICVGIDLAYTDGDSYAAGVRNHPLHSRKGHFRTKQIEDELISKNDIFGKPVYTLWKWVAESMWYTNFAEAHPNSTLINATEGGIGFPKIENISLAEVKQKYLNKQFDLKTRLHGEIQNAPLPKNFTEVHILRIFESLKESLIKCGNICIQALNYLKKELEQSEFSESNTKKIAEEEERLASEPAYEAVLKRFNDDYLKRNELSLHRLERENALQGTEFYRKKALLDQERLSYLKDSCLFNASLIEDIVKKHQEASQRLKAMYLKNEQMLDELRLKYPLPQEPEGYHFDAKSYKIKDLQLHIDYEENLAKKNIVTKESLFYPSGTIKVDMHYKGDELHGPFTVYGEKGNILGISWYIHGKQTGKTQTFYDNGQLHSLKPFKQGLAQGSHEYFYRNGLPKSIIPYEAGKLHGEVFLFYPSGILFRCVNFDHGKRHGQEQIWNEEGQFLIDCHFENGKPVGITREWHPNGILAKEVFYDGRSQRVEEKRWDVEGNLIEDIESKNEDYFDLVGKETDKLTASLGDVVNKMTGIAPLISEKFNIKEKPQVPSSSQLSSSSLEEEIANLQREMKKLQDLDGKLKDQLFGADDESKEPIWRTPTSRREMEKQFESMREKLKTDLEQIHKGIQSVFKSLKDKQ